VLLSCLVTFHKGIFALSLLGFTSLGIQPAHACFTGCGTTSAAGTIADLPTSCLVGDKLYSDFSTDIPGSVLIQLGEVGTGKWEPASGNRQAT
jgi:hypothetical protein